MQRIKEKLTKVDGLKAQLFDKINHIVDPKSDTVKSKLKEINELDLTDASDLKIFKRGIRELTRMVQDSHNSVVSDIKKDIYSTIEHIYTVLQEITHKLDQAEETKKKWFHSNNDNKEDSSGIAGIVDAILKPKNLVMIFGTIIGLYALSSYVIHNDYSTLKMMSCLFGVGE